MCLSGSDDHTTGKTGKETYHRIACKGRASKTPILILPFITHLQVGYWKDMEQEEAAEKVKTEGNESSVLLTGLEGNTLYHLTVRAYNAAGYGPPSTTVRVTTKKSRK